jgi:hypothetical protein
MALTDKQTQELRDYWQRIYDLNRSATSSGSYTWRITADHVLGQLDRFEKQNTALDAARASADVEGYS